MKAATLTVLIITMLIIAACSSVKKSSSSTTSSSPATQPSVFLKPGPPVPGDAELTAIHTQYKEVTIEQLKEGYAIYSQGACINCHGAKDIYEFGAAQWKDILEDMAQKANLSDADKDAVYKYVLSIKATQPN